MRDAPPKNSPSVAKRDRTRSAVSKRGHAAGGATLKDVARIAGVSAQTVSCAINGRRGVSDEVRERVLRIAGELSYAPNRSAKAMRTGRSQILGLVVSDIRQPFVPELAYAVQSAAAEAGYSLLLVDTHGAEREGADRVAALKTHPVDGVLCTAHTAPVARLGLPTVIIGNPAPGIDSIRADDEAGGILVADHLIARGHRAVGMVTSPAGGCIPVRRKAFVERFTRQGEVRWEAYTSPFDSVDDSVRESLKRRDVTAIVCSHDVIAIHVLRALYDQGRHAPSDVSVVGFDDIAWASIVTPTLTTVRQPLAAMGKGSIALLISRLAHPAAPTKRLKLPMELVDRESVLDISRPGDLVRRMAAG